MGKLDRKVAIVTGGSRGIGRGICKELAIEGAHVVINYTSNKGAAENTQKEVEDLGGQAMIVQADIAKKQDIDHMVEEVYKHYGKIDILVNNAGVCPFKDFFEIDVDTWDKTLNINLRGMFLCSQAVGKHMKAQGKGSIINVTSVTAVKGGSQQVHYAAAKGGGNSLTTSMANALGGYGIRVNAILCGGVITDINRFVFNEQDITASEKRLPIGRLGQPEDLGKAVTFLASSDSAWVTGALLAVDGGSNVI